MAHRAYGTVVETAAAAEPVAKPGMREVLTQERFMAWLEAREPEVRVGERGKTNACPVACFLHESGFPEANVGYTGLWDATQDLHWRLPYWAQTIVSAVDGAGDTGQPVYAPEVLQYLTID